ncbi:metallophosphoesterase family protein [Longirhabdus pacifica]|uniref:metallophosphoesterase family protein n=1 Tax=Longirhabdus pacifica TaxID=2305227 RepID=UPI001008A5C2|nr:metallophosphoesterase family protein [Longirhabdus pacifica]
MKIAALYDIHGNLPALNAVLEELNNVQPDLIVIGGDIVSGPMPIETLERLLQLGDKVRFIRGNGDREVVLAYGGDPLHQMYEKGREKQLWVAKQMKQSHCDFLSQLPEVITIHLEDLGDILFCHATPQSDEHIFTPHTSMQKLTSIFDGVDQRYVVCGHTHIQFKQQVGIHTVLNSGSVGMPFADQPGAYWLLLSSEGYEFKRTLYNKEKAAQQITDSASPHAEEFIETNVFNVLTKAKGMELLENLARRQ